MRRVVRQRACDPLSRPRSPTRAGSSRALLVLGDLLRPRPRARLEEEVDPELHAAVAVRARLRLQVDVQPSMIRSLTSGLPGTPAASAGAGGITAPQPQPKRFPAGSGMMPRKGRPATRTRRRRRASFRAAARQGRTRRPAVAQESARSGDARRFIATARCAAGVAGSRPADRHQPGRGSCRAASVRAWISLSSCEAHLESWARANASRRLSRTAANAPSIAADAAQEPGLPALAEILVRHPTSSAWRATGCRIARVLDTFPALDGRRID
jgi:hypothetical protein